MKKYIQPSIKVYEVKRRSIIATSGDDTPIGDPTKKFDANQRSSSMWD